jgi:hypothetical protein
VQQPRVEKSEAATVPQPSNPPAAAAAAAPLESVSVQGPSLGSSASESFIPARARGLFSQLGNNAWNEKGELVSNGSPIARSNVVELMDFATSRWKNKYHGREPLGYKEFLQMAKDKNATTMLTKASLAYLKTPTNKGYATPSRGGKAGRRTAQDEQRGLELLNSGRHMRSLYGSTF